MRYLDLAAICGAFLATEANATAAIERYSYTYITPGPANFSSSSFAYNNTINFDSTAGSLEYVISFQAVATGISIYGPGMTTTSVSSLPDGTPSATVDFVSPGGDGQGYGFDYSGTASTDPTLSFLSYGVVGGNYALTFSGGGTNLLDVGGRFFSSIVIDGDWSDPASHTMATFDPGYSIDQDFVYDAIANKTTFTIETGDYENNNPAISFSLLGDVVDTVPEPGTWMMMIGGFSVIGAAMRVRKRAVVFAVA